MLKSKAQQTETAKEKMVRLAGILREEEKRKGREWGEESVFVSTRCGLCSRKLRASEQAAVAMTWPGWREHSIWQVCQVILRVDLAPRPIKLVGANAELARARQTAKEEVIFTVEWIIVAIAVLAGWS